MTPYLWLGVAAVASYFIGAFNAAINISNHYAKKDIRNYGSGNAGTTNMLRTFGPVLGTMTFFADVLKGSLATFLGMLPGLLTGDESLRIVGGMLCGLIAVVGHNWPVYYRFRGGKGVACTAGTFIVIDPLIGIIVLVAAIGCIFLCQYVSVASITGTFVYGMALVLVHMNDSLLPYYLIYAVIAWLMVLFSHRENIRRLAAGVEKKTDLVRIFSEKKENFQQKRAEKKETKRAEKETGAAVSSDPASSDGRSSEPASVTPASSDETPSDPASSASDS